MNQPRSFFDNSWLAVKGGDVDAIVRTLGLSQVATVTWEQGLSAVIGDFWDFDADEYSFLSRVYVTPLVAGWRLAVGGWLGGGSEGGPTLDQVAAYCRDLSAEFSEAHAFTEQGRTDWFQWILAWGGNVQRLYCWYDGEALRDEGEMPSIERRIREAPQDEGLPWVPSIGDVGSIAGHFSIDPHALASSGPCEGEGVLGITDWGRRHGVPKRKLADQWDDA
jgi:hypothetical protein